MTKSHRGYKGRYNPANPKKYTGDINNITWRSTWELKFFRWLDTADGVLEWSSESIAIPYVSPLDNRIHRYYPDVLMKTKDALGKVVTTLVEIKPYKQTIMPAVRKKMTPSYLAEIRTYGVNESKWEAAQKVCAEYGWKWMIITEKELFAMPAK
jgi:hypothetical protein